MSYVTRREAGISCREERVFSPNGRPNLQRESEISSWRWERSGESPISHFLGFGTSQENVKMKNELMQCGRYQGGLFEEGNKITEVF